MKIQKIPCRLFPSPVDLSIAQCFRLFDTPMALFYDAKTVPEAPFFENIFSFENKCSVFLI